MIDDISFLYSDHSIPEDERSIIYAHRDLVAKRYADSPQNVEKYDPFSYNFGVFCESAENIAKERIHIRNQMQQENKMR